MTTGIARNIFRKAVVLTGIAAMVVALRLFVFQTDGNDTKPAAEGAVSGQLLAVVRTAIPDVAKLTPGQAGLLEATGESGETLALVFETSDMSDTLIGYGGKVPVAIVLTLDGTVAAIRILGNLETPSYIDHVVNRGLLNRFNGLTVEQALTARVDAVSGATMSSEAILSSVRSGMAAVQGVSFGHQSASFREILARIGTVIVLLAGLAMVMFPAKLRKFRTWLLVADVIVLGFIGGTTLSLAQFASWITNGPTIPRGLIPFTAFLIAAAVPLVSGRQVWCNCLCPFGAASELISKIPSKKLRLGTTARKIARFIGLIYLSTLIGLLVVWPTLDLASFEPFAAFSLAAAPIASVIIFGLFFLLSLVCPRFWCRFLCPTGRILDAFAWAGRRPGNDVPACPASNAPASRTNLNL